MRRRHLPAGPARCLVAVLASAVAVLAPVTPTGAQESEAPGAAEARARQAGLAQLAFRLEEEIAAGSMESFLTLWTPDALHLDPSAPAGAGWRGVAHAWGPRVADARCACRFRVIEMEDAGEWAWIRGHLEGELQTEGRSLTFVDDQLLLVARLLEEGWRITRASRTPTRLPAARGATDPASLTGVEVTDGVPYAAPGGFELSLDLHRPESLSGPLPGVVLVPGDGWDGGTRRSLDALATALAARGYVAALIDYRLPGEAAFPAAVEDARGAVRWLRANAAEIGVDPGRIAVVGASTGSQVAALVALTDRLEGEGPPLGPPVTAEVQAVALASPLVDLVAVGERHPRPASLQRALHYALGASYPEAPDAWRGASPVTYVTAAAPPVLLLHASEDTVTTRHQALTLLGRLAEAGVYVDLFTAGDGGHAFYVEPAWHGVIAEKIDAFLRRALGDGIGAQGSPDG